MPDYPPDIMEKARECAHCLNPRCSGGGGYGPGGDGPRWHSAKCETDASIIAAAILAERQRCAEVARNMPKLKQISPDHVRTTSPDEIADAIMNPGPSE